MALNCLENLIGLSSKEYACFTDTQPPDWNDSASGYFLTDPDFGVEMIEGCELAGWGLLTRARDGAIRDMKTDLGAALLNYFDPGLTPFKGFIGRMSWSSITFPSQPFVGHRYRPARRRGFMLAIKAFYLGFDTTGTYTIRIRSNDPTWTPPSDVTGNATANTFTKITPGATIELPFWSDAVDELEYFISVERDGANPLYNTLYCGGCGDKPTYLNYLEAAGFAADDASGAGITTNASGQGLVLDAFLTCDKLGWICELSELNGIDTLDLVARTEQLRGGALAIADMVTRQEINLCTLYNLETLQTKRNWNNKQYANNVNWIAQNLPKGVTDCFTCRAEETFYKTELIV